MKLHDILCRSAESGMELQRGDGSLPPGHNGPMGDPETPVRNTSHWLITFLKAYEITNEGVFRQAAEDAVDYLNSEEARPHGATFHHRTVSNKDACNGLIGQAWSIEALAAAAETVERSDLASLAEEVFLLHPFNRDFGLWKPVEIDGEVQSFDRTFNHQLWFAAAGGLIDSNRVSTRVEIFLDHINQNLSLYEPGLVFHKVSRDFSITDHIKCYKSKDNFYFGIKKYKDIGRRIHPKRNIRKRLIDRSIGYHSFNTYALALLYRNYPNHDFWTSKTMEQILEYAASEQYKNALNDNPYGYPYNPPGIENAYTIEVFGNDTDEELQSWLTKQMARTFDSNANLMDRNVPDSVTYAARIYEATRLSNHNINVSDPSE